MNFAGTMMFSFDYFVMLSLAVFLNIMGCYKGLGLCNTWYTKLVALSAHYLLVGNTEFEYFLKIFLRYFICCRWEITCIFDIDLRYSYYYKPFYKVPERRTKIIIKKFQAFKTIRDEKLNKVLQLILHKQEVKDIRY